MLEAFDPELVKSVKKVPCLHEFMLAAMVDLVLHPLHLMETRFIL